MSARTVLFRKSLAPGGLILDPKAPLDIAQRFVSMHHVERGQPLICHHRDDFRRFNGCCYDVLEGAALRSALYAFLDPARKLTSDGRDTPFNPSSKIVSDVIDALKAVSHLDGAVSAPDWLRDARERPPASEFIVCRNGLLHVPSKLLHDATPDYFGVNSLSFDFDVDAPPPMAWLRFTEQLWPNDQSSIDTLQEIFGLFLTHETYFQKIFLMVGPKRSGKGTIARVLRALVGEANVAAPTLSSLATNFGLWPLIGKQLAIIGDARLGSGADQAAIAERLLAVSGEDAQTVDRKFKEPWTGKLGVRFLIISNELPRITDASGALASRFVVITLCNSFYGREDHALTEKLLLELPGILNWAVAGWQRLQKRGCFIQPTSSEAAIQELEDLGSPIGVFIRERCDVGTGHEVLCAQLFIRWQDWCAANGRDHPGTAQSFGRDLRAAVPGLLTYQPHEKDGSRPRYFKGISLREP